MANLIKNKNRLKVEEECEMQSADALSQANARNKKNSSNSPLYIIKAEGPNSKLIHYLVLKLREDNPILCDIIGFEVTKPQINKLKTSNEALKYVKENNFIKINIRIPWTKIYSIENISIKNIMEK